MSVEPAPTPTRTVGGEPFLWEPGGEGSILGVKKDLVLRAKNRTKPTQPDPQTPGGVWGGLADRAGGTPGPQWARPAPGRGGEQVLGCRRSVLRLPAVEAGRHGGRGVGRGDGTPGIQQLSHWPTPPRWGGELCGVMQDDARRCSQFFLHDCTMPN